MWKLIKRNKKRFIRKNKNSSKLKRWNKCSWITENKAIITIKRLKILNW